jgi:hypothetical protein
VQRIEDSHHPRGYRELRSKAEIRKLLDRKIIEQNRQCAICQVAFTNYNDIVPDHIDPRGMGGSRRDDHPENIQAVHFSCNQHFAILSPQLRAWRCAALCHVWVTDGPQWQLSQVRKLRRYERLLVMSGVALGYTK